MKHEQVKNKRLDAVIIFVGEWRHKVFILMYLWLLSSDAVNSHRLCRKAAQDSTAEASTESIYSKKPLQEKLNERRLTEASTERLCSRSIYRKTSTARSLYRKPLQNGASTESIYRKKHLQKVATAERSLYRSNRQKLQKEASTERSLFRSNCRKKPLQKH